MKQLPFLLITLLILWQTKTSNAQLVKSIGIRSGFSYNFPGIKEEFVLNGTSYPSGKPDNYLFLFGEVQVEWELPTQSLSLLTNFSYISKGYSYRASSGGYGSFSGGGSYLASAYANYATINPALKYRYTINRNSVYGFAGPYISILVDHHPAFDYQYYDLIDNRYVPKEALMLKPWILGGSLGIGTNLKSKRERLNYNLQIQYLHDISWGANFQHEENGPTNDIKYFFKSRNKTLLLSFGVQYLFRKRE